MAYIDMELVKGPELRTIIDALHGSGLVSEPIDLKKGRRLANLAGEFVKAIEAINEAGKLDDVPEAVFNYYVGIVKEGDPPDVAEKKAAADKKKAEAAAKKKAAAEAKKAEATDDGAADDGAADDKKAKADAKKAEAAAKKEEKKAAAAEKKAKAEADKKAKAEAKAEAAKAKKAEAAAKKKAPAKKAPAKKPAKPKKAVLVKAAIFGKLLLSKKTKKWDVKELVEALAAKTESPYVDTRRKCNTYIALLRTMGVLEDAGDKLVMAEWYRKALADK